MHQVVAYKWSVLSGRQPPIDWILAIHYTANSNLYSTSRRTKVIIHSQAALFRGLRNFLNTSTIIKKVSREKEGQYAHEYAHTSRGPATLEHQDSRCNSRRPQAAHLIACMRARAHDAAAGHGLQPRVIRTCRRGHSRKGRFRSNFAEALSSGTLGKCWGPFLRE